MKDRNVKQVMLCGGVMLGEVINGRGRANEEGKGG
jgi:hypothetical protein